MPPLPFTVSAQSWYPRIAAFPGSEKSPVCDSEIPITIGAVEALPLTLLEELAPLLLEHAASSPATRTATNDPPRLCAMARSSPSVPRCAIVCSAIVCSAWQHRREGRSGLSIEYRRPCGAPDDQLGIEHHGLPLRRRVLDQGKEQLRGSQPQLILVDPHARERWVEP